MIKKYGYEFNSQRPEIKSVLREKAIERAFPTGLIERLSDTEWLNVEYNEKKKTGVEIAKDLSTELGFPVYYGTVLAFCKKAGFTIRQRHLHSSIEKEITDFIRNDLHVDKVSSDNTTLGGERSNLEIDVYVPDHGVGIELNGLYWHSYVDRNPESEAKKHLTKTLLAKEKDIKLFHFTDSQWIDKNDIVKSMIRNALKKTERKIFARNCTIHEATTSSERRMIVDFLNRNHIQGGSVTSSVILYLKDFVSGSVVVAMTFGKPRFARNSYEWELLRFANELNAVVVGGFSRLLTHFIRTRDPTTIVSYADHSRSYGEVYEKCGFILDHVSKPGYCWTDGKSEPIPRYRTQKHRLRNLLNEKFDSELSENENMLNAGYRKFYDCGQLVYVWNK